MVEKIRWDWRDLLEQVYAQLVSHISEDAWGTSQGSNRKHSPQME